jgi:hypothetical protein
MIVGEVRQYLGFHVARGGIGGPVEWHFPRAAPAAAIPARPRATAVR